ncbi:hypothetical protein EON65_25440 [archaeon]|nr:MAG: hypothetical protein EON65_25440 [archaeon]
MLLKPKALSDLAGDPKKEAKEIAKAPVSKPTSQLSKSVSIKEGTDSKEGAKNATASKDTKPSSESKESTKPAAPQSPAIKEALRALNGGLTDAIVDIHVSATEQQEADIARNGYIQLLQDSTGSIRRSTQGPISTFGNKASLWLWRRSQGTCSGRFKPIVDIILESASVSSDLVLAGYICDPVPIAGQYLWIKRATTDEEEKDAIIDLFVTTGKMKNASDSIWQSPGVGWIRVDGNFSKGFFSSLDTFLWYRPARTRSTETQYTNPLRGAVAMSDENRQAKLIAAIRLALRHYIPIQDVKRLSQLVMDQNAANLSTLNTSNIRSERMMDYSSLFHRYDSKGRMSSSRWAKMLNDIGIRLKNLDSSQAFHFFDINHNGFISIDEYTRVLTLTEYEVDLAVEKIRQKLLMPCVPKDAQQNANNKSTPALAKTTFGVIGALALSSNSQIGKHKIRESRALSSVFKLVNNKGDDILSLDELMDLAAKVEVFLTEEEARKMMRMLDVNNDDRVDETDFIVLMKRESSCIVNKAYRIRETAALLRRWLVRGSTEKVETSATATASKEQWKTFKQRYEKTSGQKFPGYISGHTLQITMATLGVWISSIEARELSLIIAPEKNGRVHLSELHAFMVSNVVAFV